ncbi:hypothetical protein AVEN_46510-1 [Araneus ventricosus]|uniref:Uncharacterized protein n=1 Tax=Araneus ventricosus TaxID=182803 RepID=A0A4Y2HBL7_ARAVE|nr:hypothetical protein AVEN_46510-1 [Araneus ventricosus]
MLSIRFKTDLQAHASLAVFSTKREDYVSLSLRRSLRYMFSQIALAYRFVQLAKSKMDCGLPNKRATLMSVSSTHARSHDPSRKMACVTVNQKPFRFDKRRHSRGKSHNKAFALKEKGYRPLLKPPVTQGFSGGN